MDDSTARDATAVRAYSERMATLTARCCIAGGGPAGHDARSPAGAGRRRRRRAGEARRLPARLPRRHHPPLHARGHPRARRCWRSSCALPHQRVPELAAQVGDRHAADRGLQPSARPLPLHRLHAAVGLPRLPGPHGPAVPDVPPADAGRGRPGWSRTADRVVGVRAATPEGPLEVRADLVVAADGRHSVVRERAGLPVETSARRWTCSGSGCRARPAIPTARMGRFDAGRIFITLNRGDYWQCGFVIAKGALDALRARGSRRSAATVARLAPFAADRVGEIRSLGRREAARPCGSTGCGAGTGRACSASATPRTPCRRSAASASTSRSRTRWPPPTLLAAPLRGAPPGRRPTSRASSAAASGRRASPSGCRCSSSGA